MVKRGDSRPLFPCVVDPCPAKLRGPQELQLQRVQTPLCPGAPWKGPGRAWRQGRASPGILRIFALGVGWRGGCERCRAGWETWFGAAEPGHPVVAAASCSPPSLPHPALPGWTPAAGRPSRGVSGCRRWQMAGTGGPLRPSAAEPGGQAAGRDLSGSRHCQPLPLDHRRTQSRPPEVPGAQRGLVLG